VPFDAGARVGPYLVERAIGAGGMGRVFRAFDTRLERAVALKVLSSPAGGGDASAQLLAEARSASALNHPHICTVYEVGEHEGSPFIAMEFIDGPSLLSRLGSGPLPLSGAIRFAWQVADAIAHAHERRVIHRDLKTANVMVAEGDRAKVVDFGLAYRASIETDDTVTLTMPPSIVGTLASMAPEQIRGDHLDPRCDVWALGVLMHELLTGTRPFEGRTTFELSDRILHGDPAQLPHSVPPRVKHVVQACLVRNRDGRLRDGGEVRVAIEGLADLLADQAFALSMPRRHGDAGPAVADSAVRSFRLQAPPAIAVAQRTVFAGREAEWARLEQCWSQAQEGRRQAVLIAGEPGIGKSRLTIEFARFAAERDAAVLMGRCDEEALIAYQPFVEAVRQYVAGSPDAVLAHDAAAGVTHLDVLAPEIRKRVPHLVTPSDVSAEGQRFQLFESLVALVGAIASRQPVLLVLDDLHWADKATLLMLRHLLRAALPARLLVVGTYRDTEADASQPLQELLAELRNERDVTRMPLRGLEAAAVGRVLQAWTDRLPATSAVATIRDGTEGNPFFIVEALQHLVETGQLAKLEAGSTVGTLGLPEGVKETIGRRVARLGSDVGRVLTWGAVVGRDFPAALLGALGEFLESTLLDALDTARRAGLIVEVPAAADRYSFTHALVRETLYDGLSGLRRARAHLKVAETLERTAPAGRLPLADLAHHYLLGATAGDPARAVDFCVRAGEHAASRLAQEEAARFYLMAMQALELVPDHGQDRMAELAARRGQAFAAIGQWAQSREAYERAIDYLADRNPERRAEILLDLAMAAFWQLETKGMRRLAEEALALAEPIGRRDLEAKALAWIARERQAEGFLEEAITFDRQALAREQGVPGVALCHAALSLYLAGRSAEGVALGATVAQAAKQSGDTGYVMYSLPGLALSLVGIGRYREGAGVFQDAQSVGKKYGVPSLRARAMAMSAGYHVDLYALGEAETLQLEARELARSAGFTPPQVSASVDLLFTYVRGHDVGRADALRPKVGESLPAGGWHGWLWKLRFTQASAEIAAGLEDWDRVIEAATSAIEQARYRARGKYEALGLATLARALHARNRTREALNHLAHAAVLARATGDPALELRVLAAALAIEPGEADGLRAAALVRSITEEIVGTTLAPTFEASEPVSLVRRLTART
jgi:tetratricopeptide (TPR) repeat protein